MTPGSDVANLANDTEDGSGVANLANATNKNKNKNIEKDKEKEKEKEKEAKMTARQSFRKIRPDEALAENIVTLAKKKRRGKGSRKTGSFFLRRKERNRRTTCRISRS